MQDLKPGVYQHFKNHKFYHVLGIGKHSETLEEFVVYEALYENLMSKLWIRPKSMFLETVMHEGKEVPRFTFIKE